MNLKFWGTRGSIPVPGKGTIRYGGNTPCVEIISSDNNLFIFDAGTGIRELGDKIITQNIFKEINIFITHTHWDHIHGLPFFRPLYNKNYKINIYAYGIDQSDIGRILDDQMQPFFFPVNSDELQAEIQLNRLSTEETLSIGDITVEMISLNHPRQTIGFKIRDLNKSLIYMTDNEILYNTKNGNPAPADILKKNRALLNFCSGGDYLIHDSMYHLQEYEKKIGWGHSNNISVAYFSILADIKNLILFHYEPGHSDEKIDELLKGTKQVFEKEGARINCIAASELMEFEI